MSSSCVPESTMQPWSMTRMQSASLTVASRCAMTSIVRFWRNEAIASWISVSDCESRADVGSSSNRIGEILEECPCNCDALALPAGQTRSPGSASGVVPVRQFLGKDIYAGCP